VGLVVLVICVVWIICPFIVDSHFRAMRQLQRETNHYLKRMAEEVVEANASRRPSQTAATPPKLAPPVPSAKSGDIYPI
jgi:hypothetical protein